MATRDELLRMGGVAEGGEDDASASPSVEELLTQGGAREEAPGIAESTARGAYQGATFNGGDEAAGVADAFGEHLGRLWKNTKEGNWAPGGSVLGDLGGELRDVTRDYRKGRDEARAENADAERSNPVAYGVGQFGGAMASGLATGGGSALAGGGLKGAMALGAAEGAAGGLGASTAELTVQDVKEYARAFGDTLKGGALGAVGGAAGYGIGKGVKWAGGKAKAALGRARGAMVGEAQLAQEAEDKLAREAAQEAEVKMGKAHAQALDMDGKLARRQAQEAGQKAVKEARAKAQAEKAAAREAEAPTETFGPARAADQEAKAAAAAQREANRAQEAGTQVDKGLRAQHQENIAAARAAEKQAMGEARAAQKRAEDLERAHGVAKQANKQLDAARAARDAKAARTAQREAEGRAAKAKREGDAMDRQHGQALEANKAPPEGQRQPRPAVSPDAPAAGPAPAPPRGRRQVANPDEDPNTIVLQGFQGQANAGMRMHRERLGQARAALEKLEGPQRAPDEQYLRDYGDAEAAPADYLRRMVRQQMERRGYSPEVIERMMQVRVGPQGNILPRAQPSAAGAQAVEEAAENPALLRQREKGFGSQNMGAARMGQETVAMPNAHIRDAQVPSGDPFHDAPTRAAMIRMSPPEGIQGLTDNPLHQFEFRDPKTGKDYMASFEVDPANPEVVHLNYVGPAGMDPRAAMMSGYDASKNALGPGMVKQMAAEAARAFPGARKMSAWRITGANADREMSMRLPEVTQVGDAPLPSSGQQPSALNSDSDTIIDRGVRESLPPANPNARRTAGIYEVPTTELDDIPVSGGRKPAAAAEIRRTLERGDELAPVRVNQGPDGLRELEDGNHRLAVQRERRDPYVWAQFDSDAAAQVSPNRPRGTSMFDDAVAPIDSRQSPLSPAGGDPFHDAPTRVGLVEVTPKRSAEYMAESDEPLRIFEFRDPKTGRPVEIRAHADAREPDLVVIDGVGFADLPASQTYQEAAAASANRVGPRTMKEILPEVARAFPGRTRVGGNRVTGINPGRWTDAPLPEVTQRMDLGDAIKQGRWAEMQGAGGGGSAFPNGVPKLRPQTAPEPRPTPPQVAAKREQGALGDVAKAGWEGMRGANNALAAPVGAAVGITKEALKNPAARARAISMFRLDRLANTRPEVYARVGGLLSRAMEKGPEHYAAKRHVLLLTDPELRQAEAEADKELQGLDDDALAARLSAAK